MSRGFTDQHIRLYLLGDMTAAEEDEIEEAFFRDPELLVRIELARDDLSDDYFARRLSDADREKFERRLPRSREERRRLVVTRALRHAALSGRHRSSRR